MQVSTKLVVIHRMYNQQTKICVQCAWSYISDHESQFTMATKVLALSLWSRQRTRIIGRFGFYNVRLEQGEFVKG